MEKKILKVIRYFSLFSYPPSFDEIFTFLSVKTTRKRLKQELNNLASSIRHLASGTTYYTLPQYSNFFKKRPVREQNSLKKIAKIKIYLRLLSLFPQIKLVGLSGTVAMMNAKREDDIDLFIITAGNRLWTGRLICLLLAQFLGLRRARGVRRAQDKVCLNLFFDEKNLKIPKNKRTNYVAHELLQMKTLISKDDIYQRLFDANRWVYDIFPNSKFKIKNEKLKITIQNSKLYNFSLFTFNLVGGWLEFVLKNLQLSLIKKHQTREIITGAQLWFFPEDFESKTRIDTDS